MAGSAWALEVLGFTRDVVVSAPVTPSHIHLTKLPLSLPQPSLELPFGLPGL